MECKIIKENIEEVFLPLTEKYLGIKIKSSRKFSAKLQTTLEREADFLRIVTTEQQEKFILHIEFQTSDEADMVYRMAEYNAILLRKYKLPVRQFVIFLGEGKPKMITSLPEPEVISGFQLTNLKTYNYRSLLVSDIPEEIILAILSDYSGQTPIEVIRHIIRRLQKVSKDEIKLRKYIKQLTVLSRLRKLEVQTKKLIKDMPITYDIKTDGLYKEGRKEGKREGKQEGKQEAVKEIIIEMLKDPALSLEKIARFARVSPSYVQQIQKEAEGES